MPTWQRRQCSSSSSHQCGRPTRTKEYRLAFGSKRITRHVREYLPPAPGCVLSSHTTKQWLSREAVPLRTFPWKHELFIQKPSSYGCSFIFAGAHLLKTSASGERGVEAHILGLGAIQLARTHKADTRTKLLAVLVWLSSRATHSCAKEPPATFWKPH